MAWERKKFLKTIKKIELAFSVQLKNVNTKINEAVKIRIEALKAQMMLLFSNEYATIA